MFSEEAYRKRVRWFCDARFGMFLHFGAYAIPGRGEWLRSDEEMREEEYLPFVEEFCPDQLSMQDWAEQARNAGVQYVVMTAKHHDGFCLFDSRLTTFSTAHTRCRRDLVREFVDAMRAEGLRVGLYYSLLDWHHPDFPMEGDRYHPMRNRGRVRREEQDFSRYLDYCHGQIRELCENYGKLDLLWFDFSYDNLGESQEKFGNMRGERWRAAELMEMVRSIQPEVVVNNRLEVSGEGFGSLWSGKPSGYHGDFITPEQTIPPQGIRSRAGKPLPWEACLTMNDHWGYCQKDHNFKTDLTLIRKLVECVSKGGNMILNVGPDARGNFPEESRRLLAEIGDFLHKNGESVYCCTASEFPKPEYGRFTQRGNTLYYHVMENSVGPLAVPAVPKERVQSVRLLSSGAEIPISASWVHSNYPDLLYLDLGSAPRLPDERDTVVKLILRDKIR